MNQVIRTMTRPLTSSRTDAKWTQIACWLASGIVLLLGMLKLTTLPLSETELFFGLLLVLTVGLLCVLLGLVVPRCSRVPKSTQENNS
jgi:hypothetical protein